MWLVRSSRTLRDHVYQWKTHVYRWGTQINRWGTRSTEEGPGLPMRDPNLPIKWPRSTDETSRSTEVWLCLLMRDWVQRWGPKVILWKTGSTIKGPRSSSVSTVLADLFQRSSPWLVLLVPLPCEVKNVRGAFNSDTLLPECEPLSLHRADLEVCCSSTTLHYRYIINLVSWEIVGSKYIIKCSCRPSI